MGSLPQPPRPGVRALSAFMPVSLPINPFQIDSTPSNAYDVCLMIEGRASGASDTRGHKPSELVCARLLGYMLIHAPIDTGRDYLAKEILSCTDDDGLERLAKFYFNHLIRLCAYSLPMQWWMVLKFILAVKSAKGPTPSPSLHPSRPSFDDDQEALKHGLVKTPEDQSTAKKYVSHHVSSTWSNFFMQKNLSGPHS
jgi:hypothetical protein